MTLRIWDVFLTLFRRDEDLGEEDDEGRFVPSPLNLSVRVSHGGPDDEIVRELANIDEQAHELEESRRGN